MGWNMGKDFGFILTSNDLIALSLSVKNNRMIGLAFCQ